MSQFQSWVCALLTASAIVACSSSDAPPPAVTGATCTVPAQCYPAVDSAALRGSAVCITKIPDGYCSHACTTDSDCCAVPGECIAGRKEVCAPFSSMDGMYCLLSCEDADVTAANATDANALCANVAGPAFGCRSSGGGSANRKFCSP